MDVLTAMQGNADGHGKGLTTYPDSTDRELMDAHAECLELEKQGKVTRYIDRSDGSLGEKHIIWMPAEPLAATPFFDTDEPEKKPA